MASGSSKTRKRDAPRGERVGRKKKKGKVTVPLPEKRPLNDHEEKSDEEGLEEEDLELLDIGQEQLSFLEHLPKKAIDKAVSQTREKERLLRHDYVSEERPVHPKVSRDETAAVGKGRPDSEDGDTSMSEEEVGEDWERGPRKRREENQGEKERRKVHALPVKQHIAGDSWATEMPIDTYIGLDANTFPGVKIIDDGFRIQKEEEEMEKKKKKEAEELRQRIEREKDNERREKEKAVKEAQDARNKARRSRDDILRPLETCKTPAKRRELAKHIMARAAQTLLAEPEMQLNGQVSILLELVADQDIVVSKLAMLSILSVMKDLIPAYRIRPLHEREQEDVILSKEVKQLWEYEGNLLKAYQSYLKLLLKCFRDQKSSKSALSLSRVAAKCLSNLITSVPHFNFSGDILQVMVPGTSSKDEVIRNHCCTGISNLLQGALMSADTGQAAVEATQLIADLVRRRKCTGIPPDVVTCLLQLTFPDISSGEDFVKATKERKKKKKKGKKKTDDVDRAFKEAQAVVDRETKRNQQSSLLEALFEIFFRVLKTLSTSLKGFQAGTHEQQSWSSAKFSRKFPLVLPILDGLAKFSHLISVDYFHDLIATLEGILSSHVIPTNIRCKCLLTATIISKGQGESLNIDREALYVQLYKAMLHSIFKSLEEDDQHLPSTFNAGNVHDYYPPSCISETIIPHSDDGRPKGTDTVTESFQYLLAKLLESMVMDSHKTLDIHRQAAFTKRVGAIALHSTDTGLSLGMLYVVYRMMKRYPKLRSMLEEDEGAGPASSYYSSLLSGIKSSKDKTKRKGKSSKQPHQSRDYDERALDDTVGYEDEGPSQHPGALYTPLWELSLIAAHHFNPGLRSAAAFVASMNVRAAEAAASESSAPSEAGSIPSLFPSETATATPCSIVAHNSTQQGAFHPSVRSSEHGNPGHIAQLRQKKTAGKNVGRMSATLKSRAKNFGQQRTRLRKEEINSGSAESAEDINFISRVRSNHLFDGM